ncbi:MULTISPECIES: hypothetical protein [unclassified Agrococcus]
MSTQPEVEADRDLPDEDRDRRGDEVPDDEVHDDMVSDAGTPER